MIYTYAFAFRRTPEGCQYYVELETIVDNLKFFGFDCFLNGLVDTSLLLTCRKIYNEARLIPFEINDYEFASCKMVEENPFMTVFYILPHLTLGRFLGSLNADQCAALSSITLVGCDKGDMRSISTSLSYALTGLKCLTISAIPLHCENEYQLKSYSYKRAEDIATDLCKLNGPKLVKLETLWPPLDSPMTSVAETKQAIEKNLTPGCELLEIAVDYGVLKLSMQLPPRTRKTSSAHGLLEERP